MKTRDTSRSADETARSNQSSAQAPDHKNIAANTNEKDAPSVQARSRRKLEKRIQKQLDKMDASQDIPRVRIVQMKGKNIVLLGVKGTESLRKAIGADDLDFLGGTIDQLSNASSRNGTIDESQLNFMVSSIKGAKPRDQIEAMLTTQMAVMHPAVMRFAIELTHAESKEAIDSIGNVVNKLARTFTTLVETLQRYRSTGEQKLSVQNVSVSEGSQAIVGNVTQNAPDSNKVKATITPLAITDARAVPMPIIEQSAQPVTTIVRRRPRQ
jgi:hypothetical protein